MKLKKLGALLLCLTMIFSLLPLGGLTALAEETYVDGLVTYSFYHYEDSVELFAQVDSCDSAATGEITIPAEINGCTVEKINEYAFQGCSEITGISLPESINYIGSNTFSNCSKLESIEIPQNIEGITYEMFSNCSALKNVSLPDGLLSIGNSAFSQCTALETIDLPDTVKNIGECAFYNCESLLEIEIPESVTRINSETFRDCYNLEKVTLPDSITLIGNQAFYRCQKLGTINFPKSLTKIDINAFAYCESLTSAIIPDTVVTIEESAFYYCTKLSQVSLPKNLVYLGQQAFCDCHSLKSITIPEKIKMLRNSVFANCYLLEEVNLHDGITYIGDSVFAECNNLKTIKLPQKLTHIGMNAFNYCSSLNDVVIPDSVTYIGDSAFYYCSSLTNIVMPESLEHLGNNAFYQCYNLKEIVIPEGVSVLERYLLWGCTSLKKIKIPTSVALIENNCFSECYNLKYIEYSGSQEMWNEIVFGDNNENLTEKEITFLGCSCGGMYGDWETTVEPTCLQTGFEKITCDKCGEYRIRVAEKLKHNPVEGICTLCEKNVIIVESDHNYTDNFDYTWVVPVEGADVINIKFSADSFAEETCDFVEILDVNDNLLYSLTGSQLSSKSVNIKGDTVKIRFFTDFSNTAYGFYAEVMCIEAFGDVDNDGVVNATDLSNLKKFILGGIYNVLADVDSDNSLTLIDLVRMKKIALGVFEWEDNTGSGDNNGDGGNGEDVVPQPPTILNNTYRLYSRDDRKGNGDLFMCELYFPQLYIEYATLRKATGEEDSSVRIVEYDGETYYIESATRTFLNSSISTDSLGHNTVTLRDSENENNYIVLDELDTSDLQITEVVGFDNLFETEIFGFYSSETPDEGGSGGDVGVVFPEELNYIFRMITDDERKGDSDLYLTDLFLGEGSLLYSTLDKTVEDEVYEEYTLVEYNGETYYKSSTDGEPVFYDYSLNENGTYDVTIRFDENGEQYVIFQQLADRSLEVKETVGVPQIKVGDIFEVFSSYASDDEGTDINLPASLQYNFRLISNDDRKGSYDCFMGELNPLDNLLMFRYLDKNIEGQDYSDYEIFQYDGEAYHLADGSGMGEEVTYSVVQDNSTGLYIITVRYTQDPSRYMVLRQLYNGNLQITEVNNIPCFNQADILEVVGEFNSSTGEDNFGEGDYSPYIGSTYRMIANDERAVTDNRLFCVDVSLDNSSIDFLSLNKVTSIDEIDDSVIEYNWNLYYIGAGESEEITFKIGFSDDSGLQSIIVNYGGNTSTYFRMRYESARVLRVVESNIDNVKIGDTFEVLEESSDSGNDGEIGIADDVFRLYVTDDRTGTNDLLVCDIAFEDQTISIDYFNKVEDGTDYTGYKLVEYNGETYYKSDSVGYGKIMISYIPTESGTDEICVNIYGTDGQIFNLRQLDNANLEVTHANNLSSYIIVGDVFEPLNSSGLDDIFNII